MTKNQQIFRPVLTHPEGALWLSCQAVTSVNPAQSDKRANRASPQPDLTMTGAGRVTAATGLQAMQPAQSVDVQTATARATQRKVEGEQQVLHGCRDQVVKRRVL